MDTVKINQDDVFMVNNYRLVICKNNTIYFLKDLDHKDVELEEYVDSTRRVVKYLHDEGFIEKKKVKVGILSNN